MMNLPDITCPNCGHLAPVKQRGLKQVEFDFHPKDPVKDPHGERCPNSFSLVPDDAVSGTGATAHSLFYALHGTVLMRASN